MSASVAIPALAVLIDGENISPRHATPLFRQIDMLGVATVRKVFGDWRGSTGAWKDVLPALALEPVQQFAYAHQSNASDIALVIAAMDLLHEQHVDGFCLVSGDGDFTPLAVRLRSARKIVYGFGPMASSKKFAAACDQYFHFPTVATPQTPIPAARLPPQPIDGDVVELLTQAVSAHAGAGGWTPLQLVGDWLARNVVDYRASRLGAGSLHKVLVHAGVFDVARTASGNLKVRMAPAATTVFSTKGSATQTLAEIVGHGERPASTVHSDGMGAP